MVHYWKWNVGSLGISIFSYKSKTVLCICLYNLRFLYQDTKYLFIHTLSHQHFILANFDFNQRDSCNGILCPLFVFGFPWLLVRLVIFLQDYWPFVPSILWIPCSYPMPFFFLLDHAFFFFFWFVGALHILCILNLCYI